MAGWGDVFSKLTSWMPTRRESLNNTIDKIKQEMKNVQNKKPFDSIRYSRLADQLLKAEDLERRSNS